MTKEELKKIQATYCIRPDFKCETINIQADIAYQLTRIADQGDVKAYPLLSVDKDGHVSTIQPDPRADALAWAVEKVIHIIRADAMPSDRLAVYERWKTTFPTILHDALAAYKGEK